MQGESQLRRILHDVDETTYQNIFAIGLREIQELGTLTDLEAAKWLYALTVGLDRVSLCDCVTEVKESRRNLCGDDLVDSGATKPSGTSQISQLLAERDRLHAEIAKLTGISRDYERLIAQRDSIASDIAHLEAILPKQQAEEQALDAAVMVYETWHRRRGTSAQIDAMATANDWPAEAMARMDRITNAAEMETTPSAASPTAAARQRRNCEDSNQRCALAPNGADCRRHRARRVDSVA